MKILITTGLGKNDIGGPFQYAHNLEREFLARGHQVRVNKFGSIERSILGIWSGVIWADKILALDTFSVGFPSVLAAKIFRKEVIIRVGGDFVWSKYVNRVGDPMSLPDFYENLPKLNLKEKITLLLIKWMIREVDFLAFNTEWQRKIWSKYYKISENRSGVVRNFIPEKKEVSTTTSKNFIWAGRIIAEKNIPMLKKFGVDIVTGVSHKNVLDKIRSSYVAVSLAHTDVCPNFIIEAVSLGKPFIITRETGLSELFPKGGIYVDPLSEEEIRNAFETMRDENTYNKFVSELRDHKMGHSWGELAGDFLKIWEKI